MNEETLASDVYQMIMAAIKPLKEKIEQLEEEVNNLKEGRIYEYTKTNP